MHVALVTHHYAPEQCAPQRRWSAFVARFIAAGHQVTVLAPSPHYPTGRAENLTPDLLPGAITIGDHGETILRVRFREHGDGLLSRSVDQAIAGSHSVERAVRLLAGHNKPDVIIATAPGLPSIPAGLLIGRLLRRPVIVEMRDAWPDLIAPSGMLGAAKRTDLRSLARSAAHQAITFMQRDAAAVVSTTATFADVLRERRMRDITVIRNGANVATLPHLPEPAPHGGPLRVLYAGTLGRAQGLSVTIDAARLAAERGHDVHLRLIGAGADEATLREAASGVTNIEVLDRIPPSHVFDHYEWADTVVVALRAWTPFEWTVPSKLYEVLSIGRHVSAAVAGEAAKIVADTGAGHVVAPEDAAALAGLWCDLAADRDQLNVGTGGRQWVKDNADYNALAAQYLTLLNGVAA